MKILLLTSAITLYCLSKVYAILAYTTNKTITNEKKLPTIKEEPEEVFNH